MVEARPTKNVRRKTVRYAVCTYLNTRTSTYMVGVAARLKGTCSE